MTKKRSNCAHSHWTISCDAYIILLFTLIATSTELSSSFSLYDVSNKRPRTFLPRHQSRHVSTSHHKASALRRSNSVSTPTKFDCVLPLLSSSSPSNNVNDNDDGKIKYSKDRILGILVLLSVPLAWGTYSPIVKYVYTMNTPVPGFVFSAIYYMIATVTLWSLIWISQDQGTDVDTEARILKGVNIDPLEEKFTFPSIKSSNSKAMSTLGGIELGSYLFIGNCCQVIGLKTVPADEAAFLVQLTTIMVPLFSALFDGNITSVSPKTWAACLIALLGVIVMGIGDDYLAASFSFDTTMSYLEDISAIGQVFSNGDALIMLAAVAYSMHVIRLGRYSKLASPLKLSASKASVEAILSVSVVLFFLAIDSNTSADSVTLTSPLAVFLHDTSLEIKNFFSSFSSFIASVSSSGSDSDDLKKAALACLWTGWVTCAYTIYAQSFGQRRVEPTEANLIYTTQPIFSSLFAWILLGESLSTSGFIGGSLIGMALWLGNR